MDPQAIYDTAERNTKALSTVENYKDEHHHFTLEENNPKVQVSIESKPYENILPNEDHRIGKVKREKSELTLLKRKK